MSAQKFVTPELFELAVQKLVAVSKMLDDNRIDTSIDSESTYQKSASAKAVYDFVTGQLAGLSTAKVEMKVVSKLPATGEPLTIYLVPCEHDANENSTPDHGEYDMHVWISGGWIHLGTTEVDLTNYWSKDEILPITAGEVQTMIDTSIANALAGLDLGGNTTDPGTPTASQYQMTSAAYNSWGGGMGDIKVFFGSADFAAMNAGNFTVSANGAFTVGAIYKNNGPDRFEIHFSGAKSGTPLTLTFLYSGEKCGEYTFTPA